MREKIKAILERLEYSGIRAIDYQRCEVAEVQIQAALIELEALFTASQFKLKTKSDTRLELINRILEKMEQMQAETAAMREALHESEDIVDMFNRMLSERASDESIVSTLDSMIDRLGRKLEVLKGGK